jgi:hypothetical protein
MNPAEPFPVSCASDLPTREERLHWLVEGLWPIEGVGIIGGAAKSFKTWMALDLAVSLSSRTACLGAFPIPFRRRVILYAAEDSLSDIKQRLGAICLPRNISLSDLDLGIITVHQIFLNRSQDFDRLHATLSLHQPSLLILDPFVRLHDAIDENSAGEVSSILGKLRALQRQFHTAIALVHHARKNRAGLQPGQALRGSTDFHAWTDVTLYMQRQAHHLELTVEHRTAASPDPFLLKLTDPETSPHLELIGNANEKDISEADPATLKSRILETMNQHSNPLSQAKLRNMVRARNESVGHILMDLQRNGLATRTNEGWTLLNSM